MKYGGGMNELPYPSDLTAAQWALIEPLLPAPKPKGRKRRVDLRKITNAIFYVLKGGTSWRMLPREFAPWKTVYHYFRLWRLAGLWDLIHDQLRDQVRVSKGRHICPQRSNCGQPKRGNAAKGGDRGYDAAKHTKGRKRHIVVDVLGLILAVAVTGANVQDRDGGQLVLRGLKDRFPRAGAGVGGWSIRRSTCGMGGEDGSVGARYRLQTKGTDWLFRFAMALDRGANLRMAGQLPSPRSGLRDQSTHERGLDQNRHDPPYGAKTRLSILRQVLR